MNQRVNRSSSIPLYQQLYEILRSRILRGEWESGDMIPPESELVDVYDVSRTTIRQVLDMLVNDGLIYRQAGRGTFVAHPTLEQGLVRIVSFTEDMRLRGFTPRSKVLFADVVPASDEIAAKLNIAPDDELARLDRLRLADGEPMSIEQSYLVHRYCPGVLQQHDYTQTPLRNVLDQEYGVRLVRAKQTIRAVAASAELAEPLSIPESVPLLHIERITYSQNDVPVEFLKIYYRADRYALYNELSD